LFLCSLFSPGKKAFPALRRLEKNLRALPAAPPRTAPGAHLPHRQPWAKGIEGGG